MTTTRRRSSRSAAETVAETVEDALTSPYTARRPFVLNGIPYTIGDSVPQETMDALPRPESLIRAGLVNKE